MSLIIIVQLLIKTEEKFLTILVPPLIACKRKDDSPDHPQPKKPRLVFTDLQRRTLQAIFKETKRPSKEMQVTIARQLGLDPSTVSNFFMNARRRSVDKWKDDKAEAVLDADMMSEMDPDESGASSPPLALNSSSTRGYDPEATPTSLKSNTVLVSATPAAVVQHLHQESGMTPTAALDL